MTIDDFDIIVSTVHESDRLDRLFRYFHAAGIVRFMLDYEPRYTSKPPIKFYRAGGYGCGLHFAEIQEKMPHRHLIYFEDDAIIRPDFCEVLNRHLSELPADWKVFAAGYAQHSELKNKTANRVSNRIRRNVTMLSGTQCLLLKAGEWRLTLAEEIRNHRFYRWIVTGGFDRNLAQWCRATGNAFYCAAKSFVGQSDCVSLITGRHRERHGL